MSGTEVSCHNALWACLCGQGLAPLIDPCLSYATYLCFTAFTPSTLAINHNSNEDMNNEVGSSSAAPPSSRPPSPQDATTTTSINQAPSFYFHRKPRVVELITILDRITWVEILVVYLLDNSFLRFTLRSLVQAIYLIPKPAGFPERAAPQPYVGGIMVSNLFCIILHIYNSAPEAGEATRGYLHGSLILDFVGQLGPSSKTRLLLLDMVILVLQTLTLAVLVEKKKVEANKQLGRAPDDTETSNLDHDAEERGERRQDTLEADSIELQELRSLIFQEESNGSQQSNPFAASDAIASGQFSIATFHLADTARQQHQIYTEQREASARAEEASGSNRDSLRGFMREVQRRRLQLQLPTQR